MGMTGAIISAATGVASYANARSQRKDNERKARAQMRQQEREEELAEDQSDTQRQYNQQRRRAAASSGRQGTLMAGLGNTGAQTTGSKTLLGS